MFMSNLIKFDLATENKHANNGGLAADFWKDSTVAVTISTWTKVLDDKSTTSRAKEGTGMLGCWLEDDKGNKGWANLSLLGKLMMETFNANQKKSWFKEDADGDLCVELDTPKKLKITMDKADKPKIVKVAFLAANAS
jgi:hypothetical protein